MINCKIDNHYGSFSTFIYKVQKQINFPEKLSLKYVIS